MISSMLNFVKALDMNCVCYYICSNNFINIVITNENPYQSRRTDYAVHLAIEERISERYHGPSAGTKTSLYNGGHNYKHPYTEGLCRFQTVRETAGILSGSYAEHLFCRTGERNCQQFF